MKIIDFHTHIFPDQLAARAISELIRTTPTMRNVIDGTRAGLLDSMRSAGIDYSVLLPVSTKPSQVTPINADAIAEHTPGLIPFGTLHPLDTQSVSQIASLRASGIRGIKLHPEYQNFAPDNPSMFPVYDALQDAGIIVVFHAGVDPGPFTDYHAVPESIARVARAFPRLKIVAAHMGGFLMWDAVEKHLCGSSVYFDTSAVLDSMSPELFTRIARTHGTEKILFGSDSPWFDQKTCVEWIDSMPLGAAEKDRIFEHNALELLENPQQ